MDQALIIKILLPSVLAFIMFSLGLTLKFQNFKDIGAYPKAFTVGLINQSVLLPLITFILIKLFNPSNDIAFGMMLLSFCPGGATSNMLCLMMRGNVALSVALTSVMSLISIVSVPILVSLSYVYFLGNDNANIDITSLGIKMFVLSAFPVLIGTLLNHYTPQIANKLLKPVLVIAWGLFFILVVAAIAGNKDMLMEQFGEIGAMVTLMMVTLLVVGLSTAKLMGLSFKDAKTIALETGIQNSTMGMALAGLVASAGVVLPVYAVPAAVYSVVMYVIAIPFCLLLRGTAA